VVAANAIANAAASGSGSQVARIPSNPFNQINQCRREAREGSREGNPLPMRAAIHLDVGCKVFEKDFFHI